MCAVHRKAVIAVSSALVYLWVGGTALIALVGSLFTPSRAIEDSVSAIPGFFGGAEFQVLD